MVDAKRYRRIKMETWNRSMTKEKRWAFLRSNLPADYLMVWDGIWNVVITNGYQWGIWHFLNGNA